MNEDLKKRFPPYLKFFRGPNMCFWGKLPTSHGIRNLSRNDKPTLDFLIHQPTNQPVHINDKVRFSATRRGLSYFTSLFVCVIPSETLWDD